MIVCKYSLKLQERQYKTLEPSELDTECALASAGIPGPCLAAHWPPQNQERLRWICRHCPGCVRGGSGWLNPAGWGCRCTLHPAMVLLAWLCGTSTMTGHGPQQHLPTPRETHPLRSGTGGPGTPAGAGTPVRTDHHPGKLTQFRSCVQPLSRGATRSRAGGR